MARRGEEPVSRVKTTIRVLLFLRVVHYSHPRSYCCCCCKLPIVKLHLEMFLSPAPLTRFKLESREFFQTISPFNALKFIISWRRLIMPVWCGRHINRPPSYLGLGPFEVKGQRHHQQQQQRARTKLLRNKHLPVLRGARNPGSDGRFRNWTKYQGAISGLYR